MHSNPFSSRPGQHDRIRSAPRFSVSIPVHLRGADSEALTARARNISESGVFVECSLRWEVGQVLEVTVPLPEGPGISVRARVARISLRRLDPEGCGIGIEFLNMRAEDRTRLVTTLCRPAPSLPPIQRHAEQALALTA